MQNDIPQPAQTGTPNEAESQASSNSPQVLSAEEHAELLNHENVLDTAQKHQLQAAQALLAIRTKRLYRQSHATFEDYCEERLQFSRCHGNRLCGWAEVVANVSPSGVTPYPTCESHARSLTRLNAEQQVRAWNLALANNSKTLTAANVAEIAKKVQMSPVNGELANVSYETARISPPLKWFGGKAQLAGRLASVFPTHTHYFEPFAGGAAVLFAKAPVQVELINDLNGEIVNFYKVLRDQTHTLERLLRLTAYARDEHQFCKDHPDHPDPIERARRFFVRCRQSYGGVVDDQWSVGTERNEAARTKTVVDAIDEVAERLRNVEVENQDFRKLLKRVPDRRDVLIYVDPPYVRSSRVRSADAYDCELTDEDHGELLDILTSYKHTRVAVSGYRTPLYNERLRGWTQYEFRQKTNVTAANGGERTACVRTEVVWVNWKSSNAESDGADDTERRSSTVATSAVVMDT